MTHDELNHNMTNHAPANDAVISDMVLLRELAKEFGHAILDIASPSREQSLAITNLEQALMWSIAAIARNQ